MIRACSWKITHPMTKKWGPMESKALLVTVCLVSQKYAANDHERAMIKEYIKSFQTGSIPAHKEGSRFWIKNKGPIVETWVCYVNVIMQPLIPGICVQYSPLFLCECYNTVPCSLIVLDIVLLKIEIAVNIAGCNPL